MKRIVSELSLLLLVCLAFIPAANAETLQERVLRTGTIRAAYIVYSPLLIKDPNTKAFSGMGYDILHLAADRLGLKLQMTEEVGFGTMIEGLKTGRYDVIACPLWANASRAKVADFSRALCFSPVYAYTKKSDKRIDASLKGLVEGKFIVATIDGEMAELITKTDYPKAKRFSLTQSTSYPELLLSVSSGKADITFAEPLSVYEFLKHNPNTLQNITPNRPLRVFPNCFTFKAGEPGFKAMLNTTLDEIANNGELDKLISKYEPFPKAYLRCPKPYN
jgi:polar amino acid transport system substrate-binding protein